MNSNQNALQHFLRLAFLRTRHMQQELVARTTAQTSEKDQKAQLNKLKILEEIIREQISHEDSNTTTRSSR
jgi:hypothetical protein